VQGSYLINKCSEFIWNIFTSLKYGIFFFSPILYKRDTGQQFLQKYAVQQAVPLNWQARSRYCRWFQESTAIWFLDPSLRFCSHEAWLTLNGKAKSHTNGHWCSSQAGHDFPLRNLRLRSTTLIHVRGTVRTRSTVGPVFFEEPTNPYRYVLLTLTSFIRQLRLADHQTSIRGIIICGGGRIILRWIFRKLDVGVWTGSSWLRIGTGGGHLWLR